MWAEIKNGEVTRYFPVARGFRDMYGCLHPKSVFTRWNTDQLRAIGIYPVEVISHPHRLYSKADESAATVEITEEKVIHTVAYEPLPLETAKEITLQEINRQKRVRQDGGFEFNGAMFQSDDRSRSFIAGAALEATIALMNSTPYQIEFRDAENEDHLLDAAGMIALGQALAAHIKFWFEWAKEQKAEVDAATTFDEVKEIYDNLIEE